jgi:hypothetical protein
MAIHHTWCWKSRFLRNVSISTTILNVATQKLLIFLLRLPTESPSYMTSSSCLVINISRTTNLVTTVSVFHGQYTARKKRKTLVHKSSRGSNKKQCVIFIHLSWIPSRHMALLDPTNVTVTWPALQSVLLVPSGNSESKVVLWGKKSLLKHSVVCLNSLAGASQDLSKRSSSTAENSRTSYKSVCEFPCWCLMEIQKGK